MGGRKKDREKKPQNPSSKSPKSMQPSPERQQKRWRARERKPKQPRRRPNLRRARTRTDRFVQRLRSRNTAQCRGTKNTAQHRVGRAGKKQRKRPRKRPRKRRRRERRRLKRRSPRRRREKVSRTASIRLLKISNANCHHQYLRLASPSSMLTAP